MKIASVARNQKAACAEASKHQCDREIEKSDSVGRHILQWAQQSLSHSSPTPLQMIQEKSEGVRTKECRIDPQEFHAYAAEGSQPLSALFTRHVNHFDVLLLFIELMKLSLKGREQERQDRMVERELQLEHIQNLVDNYKQQGQWMLFSSIGGGVLSIVSGISPIIGHMKGDWILGHLSKTFSSLKDVEKDTFFKGISQMTAAMAEMQKNTGTIQNTFADSSRVYDQHMAEMHKADWEEDTRTMDELKDQWKNMENFIHQSLQMHHEAIRQLYSI